MKLSVFCVLKFAYWLLIGNSKRPCKSDIYRGVVEPRVGLEPKFLGVIKSTKIK